MNIEPAPIVEDAFQLALNLHRLVVNFQKQARHTVGLSLLEESMQLVKSLARANHQTDLERRAQDLQEICADLFHLQLLVRMGHDLRQISPGAYVDLSRKIDGIRKQLLGWQRWVKSQIAADGGNRLISASVELSSPGH
jgi:hypothetical protein